MVNKYVVRVSGFDHEMINLALGCQNMHVLSKILLFTHEFCSAENKIRNVHSKKYLHNIVYTS